MNSSQSFRGRWAFVLRMAPLLQSELWADRQFSSSSSIGRDDNYQVTDGNFALPAVSDSVSVATFRHTHFVQLCLSWACQHKRTRFAQSWLSCSGLPRRHAANVSALISNSPRNGRKRPALMTMWRNDGREKGKNTGACCGDHWCDNTNCPVSINAAQLASSLSLIR